MRSPWDCLVINLRILNLILFSSSYSSNLLTSIGGRSNIDAMAVADPLIGSGA